MSQNTLTILFYGTILILVNFLAGHIVGWKMAEYRDQHEDRSRWLVTVVFLAVLVGLILVQLGPVIAARR